MPLQKEMSKGVELFKERLLKFTFKNKCNNKRSESKKGNRP